MSLWPRLPPSECPSGELVVHLVPSRFVIDDRSGLPPRSSGRICFRLVPPCLELRHFRDFLCISRWEFLFLLRILLFLLFLEGRDLTSTNLEYSFFLFLSMSKLTSMLKCHLSIHFLGGENQMSLLADVACKLIASHDCSSDD